MQLPCSRKSVPRRVRRRPVRSGHLATHYTTNPDSRPDRYPGPTASIISQTADPPRARARAHAPPPTPDAYSSSRTVYSPGRVSE